MTLDTSLVEGLLQSTRVNEVADATGVSAKDVEKVLAHLGENVTPEIVAAMCGAAALIAKNDRLRQVSRQIRKATPFVAPEENEILGPCETCGDPVRDDDESSDARSVGMTMHRACAGRPHPYEHPSPPR